MAEQLAVIAEPRTDEIGGIPLVDYHPTPAWVIAQLLLAVRLPGGLWLEPAYGDGAIVKAVNRMRTDVAFVTNDVQSGAMLQRNYVDLRGPLLGARHFDLVITNPPFTLALLFACQAMRDAKAVALLLRLDWMSGKPDRAGFLRSYPPAVWILPNRPSFSVGDGSRPRSQTDMREYAWFCWGCGGDPGTYRHLPPMSVADRKSWNQMRHIRNKTLPIIDVA
ncbi:MAG: hypothetical protein V3R34_01765, partial [Hyphomicrobium sp.]